MIPGNSRVGVDFSVFYNSPYTTYENGRQVSKSRISGPTRYNGELDYSQTQDKEAFRRWYDSAFKKDYTKFNLSRLGNDKYTQNDDFEKIWSQVNEAGNKYASGIGQAAADREGRLGDLQDLLGGGSNSGSGSGSGSGASQAAMIRSLVNSIEEGFGRARGALDTNKATSTANIQKNYDSFKQGVANNQALYQQGSAAIQAEITRRMAESAARNAETGGQVAAAVGGIGGSASAANAQAAANQASLASAQGFQQDMANRTDQIVGANQRSAENSGELVRQGASGNLETNYNAMLNALLAQREQNLLQAQMGAMSSGGGGGGGGGSSSKPKSLADAVKELDAQSQLEDWVNGSVWNTYFGPRATAQGQAMGAQFLAMMQDNPEEAARVFPELAAEYASR